jgi:hypothetical protein
MATVLKEDKFTPVDKIEGKQSYTVEEAFDELDAPFIKFYGEYGRQIVNARRTEWNKEKLWHFKMF